MTKEHDMCWDVDFNVTLDGEETNWFELSETTQRYILEQIELGYLSGTTGGAEREDGK